MAGIIIADGVAPDYDGKETRALFSAFGVVGDPTRPLGGLSGVKAGTPATVVTATSTTWTVLPHVGLCDVETSALAGPYPYIFVANQTGAVTAAGGSPRVDLISIRIDDPVQDGSSVPQAAAVYSAGTTTPPARCTPIATINVPASGGGSPTVSFIANGLNGGVVTVPVGGTYPATPYVGMYVDDAATTGLMRWDGADWQLYATAKAKCRVTRTASLAGVDSSGSRPGSWSTTVSRGTAFTVAAGAVVDGVGGDRFWSTTASFPSGAGEVQAWVEVNGTIYGTGRDSRQLAGTHQTWLSTGGALELSAGDSVQVVYAYLDGTLATPAGNIISFCLEAD